MTTLTITAPQTLTTEQADDLFKVAIHEGRVPFAPVSEHEPTEGGHLYALADGAVGLIKFDGAMVMRDPDA